MKAITFVLVLFMACLVTGCGSDVKDNRSAIEEQNRTEENQQGLNKAQPAPKLSWSLERDNLIKRFKLMNDRAVMFYMYLFIEGVSQPVGYYQVNKVSSVNSQLTNTSQIVQYKVDGGYKSDILPSPAEDGSYGTNGDGIFGFTPEDIYIEHNMKYVVSTVPLTFKEPVNRLAILTVENEVILKKTLEKLKAE